MTNTLTNVLLNNRCTYTGRSMSKAPVQFSCIYVYHYQEEDAAKTLQVKEHREEDDLDQQRAVTLDAPKKNRLPEHTQDIFANPEVDLRGLNPLLLGGDLNLSNSLLNWCNPEACVTEAAGPGMVLDACSCNPRCAQRIGTGKLRCNSTVRRGCGRRSVSHSRG